jgi:PleD family two-component response regulator
MAWRQDEIWLETDPMWFLEHVEESPFAPLPDRRRGARMIRVLVADDQSLVRAGFRMLLRGEQDIDVVAEASNGLEAVEKAAR